MGIKEKILFGVLLMSVFALQSCYNYRQVGLLQERKGIPQYEKMEYEPYRIRVNDEIIYRLITTDPEMARVFGAASVRTENLLYTNTYRVYSDGTIDLPFADKIPIAGLTVEEARQAVEQRYREQIPDAEVKLALANKSFTVIGDIGQGVYPIYKEKMTIFQALAMSGDLSIPGDRKHVRIIREIDGKPQVLEFDIRSNSIIESEYYYIYPNDLIYVQRASGSFYKFSTYSGFISLITSSISLLITVLYYIK